MVSPQTRGLMPEPYNVSLTGLLSLLCLDVDFDHLQGQLFQQCCPNYPHEMVQQMWRGQKLQSRHDPTMEHAAHYLSPGRTEPAQYQTAEHHIPQQYTEYMPYTSSWLEHTYQQDKVPVHPAADCSYSSGLAGIEHGDVDTNMLICEPNTIALKDIDPEIFRMFTGESLIDTTLLLNEDAKPYQENGSSKPYKVTAKNAGNSIISSGVLEPIMPGKQPIFSLEAADLSNLLEPQSMAFQGSVSLPDCDNRGFLTYSGSGSRYEVAEVVSSIEPFQRQFDGGGLMCGGPDVAGRVTRSEYSASGSTNTTFPIIQSHSLALRQSALWANEMGVATSQPEPEDDADHADAEMTDGKYFIFISDQTRSPESAFYKTRRLREWPLKNLLSSPNSMS
jgi:hypothetical protein